MLKNPEALSSLIHQTAVDHGFWDKDRNYGEMIMLAVSELSEALEEHRDGKPPIYYWHDKKCRNFAAKSFDVYGSVIICAYCTVKPEGTAVELADCVIRVLDTYRHPSVRPSAYDNEDPLSNGMLGRVCDYMSEGGGGAHTIGENFGEALSDIAGFLISSRDNWSFKANDLIYAMGYCLVLMDRVLRENVRLEATPEDIIKIKMDFNNTRPFKHGKAY